MYIYYAYVFATVTVRMAYLNYDIHTRNDNICDTVSECSGRKFGIDCGSDCGHCLNEASCDGFDGRCTVGCAPGYQGNTCVAGIVVV